MHFGRGTSSQRCGTVVMGTDPARRVLDLCCRIYELEDVWVIDAGCFASSAAMNMALTIAAQALRAVAESDLGAESVARAVSPPASGAHAQRQGGHRE